MVFMPPTQVSFCLPLVHVVPPSVIVKGEAQRDTGTDEPQVWIGDPVGVGTVQTRQKSRHRMEILRALPMGNTRENTDSLLSLEEARVLFSVGARSEACSDPWYPLSLPGVHHQPAQRHQVFPLPACDGYVHPETLCWSPGIQVRG